MILPDPETTRHEDLRRWRAQFPDAVAIANLVPRRPGVCVGVIEKLRIVPRTAIEAAVSDGTGELVALWRRRDDLPGLRLGGALRLSGTVTVTAGGGRRILNPGWESVSQPYA